MIKANSLVKSKDSLSTNSFMTQCTLFFFFLIETEVIYNIVLISSVQQLIQLYIYTCILFQIESDDILLGNILLKDTQDTDESRILAIFRLHQQKGFFCTV